ncbi:hypothetical protein BS78_K303600 [Paspalum vaginatum]|uniref:Uncharacterized protein n=1 Tax=Paspalum vaginatum TaxID=158149 RepID=A0A9W8CEA3_9POAL|nr:hypothetical protein BS78_K303600 [Paspalum vaginatum]
MTRIHRSPENGHLLNGDIRQTEIKPSTGTSEAITSAGNVPDLGDQKDEHGKTSKNTKTEISVFPSPAAPG